MSNPVLQKLGLTPKEAEVYELLLRLGEVPIADVLKETGNHPQIIYRAIDGLAGQGLAILIQKRHRKYVRAEDPHHLEEIEERRLAEVKSIIPELVSLQKDNHDAIVRVSKGNEAVRSLRIKGYEELKPNEIYYIIGGSGDRYYEIMGDIHTENERKRIKKNIFKRLITFKSQHESMRRNEKPELMKLAEYRYLEENYPAPSSTTIFNDTVSITIWEPTPIIIAIESPEVAESYKHYFESLWQIAKP